MGGRSPFIIDPYTGERRKAVIKDIEAMSRLVDALPNISFMMSMGIASDVAEYISDLCHFQYMVSNTTKPIIFTAWNVNDLKEIYNMCVAVSGSEVSFQKKPFALLYAMPTDPLQHTYEACTELIFCAEKHIPLIYVGGPLMGASSPVTIAGSLAQINAEFLGGLVLAKLKDPGAILIHGGATNPFDLKTMNSALGAPEVASFEMVTLGDEVINMARRLKKGFNLNKEMLGLNAIDRVGPGGSFMMDKHTLDFFKKEVWYPSLLDRSNYTSWEKEGKVDLGKRLNKKVREILSEHRPEPLQEHIKANLKEIIDNNVARHLKEEKK